MQRAIAVTLVVVMALARLAVALNASGADACVHPFPCGEPWPADLEGPFDVADVKFVIVPSFDGTLLQGWLVLPRLPAGVGAPTILWAGPYFPFFTPTPDDPALWAADGHAHVNLSLAVARGYAVAAFSVRGTGNSGGCEDLHGPNEQGDMAFLVEWLAAQPWSNGRVGIVGASDEGSPAYEAAIHHPPHLKTIVVAVAASDTYTMVATPQGAEQLGEMDLRHAFAVLLGLVPPVYPQQDRPALEAWTRALRDRVCPEHLEALNSLVDPLVDNRNREFWDARRLIEHFPDITASVFVTHGFQDPNGLSQGQEDPVWGAITGAPKRMLLGQWGHQFPSLADWDDQLFGWLDYWLKGLGSALGQGTVTYEDTAKTWRTTSNWPPNDARHEVLYLADGALSPEPGQGEQSFLSAPTPGGPQSYLLSLGVACCAQPWSPALQLCDYARMAQLRFETTSQGPVTIAGNPFAYLRLSSDQPGGLVSVHLYDVGPDFACLGTVVVDAEMISSGAADLRFHHGDFHGDDFPVGFPSHVRIDLANLAHVLQPGHGLVAIATHGDPLGNAGQPYAPTITLHQDGGALASHLVLPIVGGTLGGAAPTLPYPPRPFVPVGAG